MTQAVDKTHCWPAWRDLQLQIKLTGCNSLLNHMTWSTAIAKTHCSITWREQWMQLVPDHMTWSAVNTHSWITQRGQHHLAHGQKPSLSAGHIVRSTFSTFTLGHCSKNKNNSFDVVVLPVYKIQDVSGHRTDFSPTTFAAVVVP